MENPELKMTMMQITPALPDPDEFVKEITAGIKFIEENPNSSPHEIPKKMLDMWCVSEDVMQTLTARFEKLEESSESPHLVSSFILFAHLYLQHYRKEDFADFANFIHTYGRFQNLLKALRKRKSVSNIPGNIRNLFDLDNLDETIDAINNRVTV